MIRHTANNLWLFLVVLLCLIIIALVRNLYPSRIFQVSSGVFYNGQLQQMLREETERIRWSNTLLHLHYAIVLAVLTFTAYTTFHAAPMSEPLFFLLIFGGISAYLLANYLLSLLLVHLAGSDQGIHEHLFQFALNRSFTGIILLPLAFLAPFVPDALIPNEVFLILAAFIASLSHLYGLLRGFSAAFNKGIHPLYIILYLCSLEIMPFIVLGRLLSSNFN